MGTDKEIIAGLTGRIQELENHIENWFFLAFQFKASRKCIEEIVELSVVQHFGIKRSDFHQKVYDKIGSPRHTNSYDKKVIESRKWFMSIMKNMLHRTSYKMSENYLFFHEKKVVAHRPVYMSAIDGSSEEAKKTFMEICSIVRQMMLDEGLVKEEYDF